MGEEQIKDGMGTQDAGVGYQVAQEPQADDFLLTSDMCLVLGLYTVPRETTDSDKFQRFISIIRSGVPRYLFSKAEANFRPLRVKRVLCLRTPFLRGCS